MDEIKRLQHLAGINEIRVNKPGINPQQIIDYINKVGIFDGMYDVLYGWGVENYNNWDDIESYKDIPKEDIKNIVLGLKDQYEYNKSK
jgi:hypothetical protein